MLRKKLEQFLSNDRKSTRKTARHHAHQTDYQLLECRYVLATILWDGGGADPTIWGDPQNWVGDVLPGASDDAVIDVAGDATITISSNQTVNSVVSEEPITITGGTFDVTSTIQVNNTFTIAGGTLANATVLEGAGGETLNFTNSFSNFLDGVTVSGEISFPDSGSRVRISNGTTFTTARLSGSSSELRFDAGSTITGTVIFEGNSSTVKTTTPGILTIGDTGVIEVGGAGYGLLGDNNTTLDNRGIIRSQESNLTIQINAGTWTNSSGTITTSNDGIIRLGGTYDTTGSNGLISANGGSVRVIGTIDNSGETLTLDSATGSWLIDGGAVSGGNVVIADGETLNFTNSFSNFLDGVTVSGEISFPDSGSRVRISNGTTFTTARLSGSSSELRFDAGSTITGTVIFEGNSSTVKTTTPGTLTIGDTGVIEVGGAGYGLLGDNNTTLDNQGIIRSQESNLTIQINAGTWTNTGLLEAEAGIIEATGFPTNYEAITDTLTDGVWSASAGGVVRLPSGTDIAVLDATIVVGGAGSKFEAGSGVDALANLNSIETSGSLTWAGGGTLTTPGPLSVAGTLSVGASSSIAINPGDDLTLLGGATLSGQGTIDGPVVAGAGAVVAPGNSPGILYTGDFTFSDDSFFEVEIGGDTPGNTDNNHDQLNATGTVTIGNNVALDTIAWLGYTPTGGEVFTIIENDLADPISGTFAGLPEGATITNFIGSGLDATISYVGGDGNDVVLTTAPSQIIVTNTNDSGAGSLRQAILDANAIVGVDTIFFDIPGASVISVTSELPALTEATIIDATTDPDWSGSPVIQLDGSSAPTTADGFIITTSASGSTIKGLAITNFEFGIFVDASDNNTISGNYIGTDLTGTVDQGNVVNGILIQGGASNVIGGTNAEERNVISGNDLHGIQIAGVNSTLNVVQGNYIGTDRTGTVDLGNAVQGILINFDASNNVIGGTQVDEGNVISGNDLDGVQIADNAYSNVVAGNKIGTDITGNIDLGNSRVGVLVSAGATDNLIGGAGASARNIISGNDAFGLQFASIGTSGNRAEGNYIGIGADGTALANNYGVIISQSATDNIIGSTDSDRRNIISGNLADGVYISDVGTTGNQVIGNWIGVGNDGVTAVGNGAIGGKGVVILGGATDNTIGGEAVGAGNVISGNLGSGMWILGANTTDNVVLGNIIGLDATGTIDVGNVSDGISIIASPGNTIGGTTPGSRNIISGNDAEGIRITGLASTQNQVLGNYIGTDLAGSIAVGNGFNGINIDTGASQNIIGGSIAGSRNLISGNTFSGIRVVGSDVTENEILGNFIGTDSAGTSAVGNSTYGVFVQDAPQTTIGGIDPLSRNIISGNGNSGIWIFGANATDTIVVGNYIGTDVTGTTALGNVWQGIQIDGGASNNSIGGSNPGEGNLVSGNQFRGIQISGVGTSSNEIQGNYIGTDFLGTSDLGNVGEGILVWFGATDNRIGGSISGSGNVISGNGTGVLIITVGTENNTVSGNLIGVDASGANALPNSLEGIAIGDNAANNTVGGTTPEERNIISGNGRWGIQLFNGATSNKVLGNIIGLDSGGTIDVGNGADGIAIQESPNNMIGGPTIGTRNVISGNSGSGIVISGSSATQTIVVGNYIGTDVTGTVAVGNTGLGVLIFNGASETSIGGSTPGSGNLISGNLTGVKIGSAGTENNSIEGNLIGVDVTGATALPNSLEGIAIGDGASNNSVGGTSPAERNVISGNDRWGIQLFNGATSNKVLGNIIGLDSSGTIDVGNGADGIAIQESPNNLIGGPTIGTRNVISGNSGSGIVISGSSATQTIVVGNYIGTDLTGAIAVGNTGVGIFIGSGASETSIGGETVGAGNVISGNREGINIFADQTTVQGNYIGVDATGTNELANAINGIGVIGAENLIGGTAAGAGNVISGNGLFGIRMLGADTVENQVLGNLIGTDASGTVSIGNADSGILIDAGANNNLIGGSESGAGNVISGNVLDGIRLAGLGVDGNKIQGNKIGTDITGSLDLGNGVRGIQIFADASETKIGGLTPGAGNLISGNDSEGVIVFDGYGTVIQGNLVGLDVSGQNALGNGGIGVLLINTLETEVGSSEPSGRNTISGNGVHGITITGANARENVVLGNYIGTDVTGTVAIANQNGVQIDNGANQNTIGGNSPGSRNLISGNTQSGILIDGVGTDQNSIVGNFVGTDISGGVALANGTHGVWIDSGASNNMIGGAASGERNVISGNTSRGVLVEGVGTNNNQIVGNFVGTDVFGTGPIGNAQGVRLGDGSSNTVIGGSTPGAGNLISSNAQAGVVIRNDNSTGGGGALVTGTRIVGNMVGLDGSGSQVVGTQNYGIALIGAVDTVIGGTTAGERNIISGSELDGIVFQSASSDNTTILGNFIGTDVTGKIAVGNGQSGILNFGSPNVTIGGTSPGSGNLISGNGNRGFNPVGVAVWTFNSTQQIIQGNKIGTDVDGLIAVPNAYGILVQSGSDNTIGGVNPFASNLVSGNVNEGIWVGSATNTAIDGNIVGLNATGDEALGNGVGIAIDAATDTFVGVQAGNTISGNLGAGILVAGGNQAATLTTGTVIQNNYVGVDIAGSFAIGNQGVGISIGIDGPSGSQSADIARDVVVGGVGAGNIIAGNMGGGIRVDGQDHVIQDNYIGVDVLGINPIPNGETGILVQANAVNVIIGTDGDGTNDASEGNVVATDPLDANVTAIVVDGATDTQISGNRIQTGRAGAELIGAGTGIQVINGAAGTRIGTDGNLTSDDLELNVIASGLADGILVDGATGTTIAGNNIGVVTAGNALIAASLGTSGIRVVGSSDGTRIGSDGNDQSDALEANVIGGFGSGIVLAQSPTNVQIRGNFVGSDRTKTIGLGNKESGLLIDGNPEVFVDGNVFAYNTRNGVQIVQSTTNQLDLGDNEIFANLFTGIDLGTNNDVTPNDSGDADGFLNFPVITETFIDGGNLVVNGFARPGINIRLFQSGPTFSGFGQGPTFLGTFVEGSAADQDSGTGTYDSSDANGLNVGSDSTNRFSFVIPVPNGVNLGDLISAIAVEPSVRVSEFSNLGLITEPGVGGPGSSLPPVILPSTNESIDQGERLQKTINFEDFDSTNWVARVDYGDGTVEALSVRGRSATLDHVYALSGAYNVLVTITDNSLQSTTSVFSVIVENDAPDVDFNLFTLNSPVREGETVTLTGQFNDFGSSDSHTIEINWGDGNVDTLTVTTGDRDFVATHVYLDDVNQGGTVTPVDVYRVSVAVVDQGGLADSTPLGLLLAEVENVAPSDLSVNFSTLSIDENQSVTIDGSFVDPGVQDSHDLRVDWGDGTVEVITLGVGARDFSGITHVYANDPSIGANEYIVTVELVDDDEPLAPTTISETIAVANVVPTVTNLSLTPNVAIDENGVVSLSGSIADPGTLDKHSVTIIWGDGSSNTTFRLGEGVLSFSDITHQYLDDPSVGSNFTIEVQVTDDDSEVGQFGSSTIDVSVNNLDPTLGPISLSNGGQPVDEGDTITISGSIEDIGSLDRHTVMVDWGDGSTPTAASVDSQTRTYTATHKFQDAGLGNLETANITVTVTDDDGGSGSLVAPLTVNNVAPQIQIVPDRDNFDPQTINLLANLTDPGLLDTFTFLWEAWKGPSVGVADQTGSGQSFALDRSADLNAAYSVRLTVTDDNGGVQVIEVGVFVGTNNADNIVITDSVFSSIGQSVLLVLSLGDEDTIDGTAVSAGNTLILDGGLGTDQMFGGAGNDVYYLSGGNDTAIDLVGGDDRYVLIPNSTLTVIDTLGENTLDYQLADFGITYDLTLTDGTVQDVAPNGSEPDKHFVSAEGNFPWLFGSTFDDSLTAADDSTVSAGSGDDRLFASDISTTASLFGDDGADVLSTSGTLATINFTGDDGADVFNNRGTISNVIFTGGADDDIFRNEGTATNLISFTGDDGADVFSNDGTITNVVFKGGADDDIFNNNISADGLIDFTGDDGADVFNNVGNAGDIVFTGGADDDIFTNVGTASANIINFSGDDGADTFANSGSAAEINFKGGADDDLFTNASTTASIIDFSGDDGADTFNNVGSASVIVFTGGADDDIFNNESIDVSGTINFTGDDGADVFNNMGTAGEIVFTGGADDDIFNNSTASPASDISFTGDDGADVFNNTGTAASILFNGGADDDLFVNSSASTGTINFTGDDGADVFRNAGSAANIIFRGGADDDIFANTDAVIGTIDFTGDDGADVFRNAGSAADIIFSGGADDDIFVHEGSVTNEISFTGDDGADVFENKGSAQTVKFTGGADDDLFNSTGIVGGTLDFTGDDGADVFNNFGSAGEIVFAGGADDDIFLNEGTSAGAISFSGDDGADAFDNRGTAANIVFSGGADDDIFANNGTVAQTISFTGDDGADAFENRGAATNIVFSGGADDDLFANSGQVTNQINFTGDDGADVLQNDGALINTINFTGDDGADVFINRGDTVSNIVFAGGADDDIFVNRGEGIGSISFTGDDGDPLTAGLTSDDTMIVSGSGDGTGAVTFWGGIGRDGFQNNATGFSSITFEGGADDDVFQNNAASVSMISFTGDDGADVFENNGAGVSTINFTGDDGADVFANDGASVSNIVFTGGADDDIFINTGEAVSMIDFTGDDGADVFANSGTSLSDVSFSGDVGDDRFFNRGANLSSVLFMGGTGNDQFQNLEQGVGADGLQFIGDDGADVFANSAANATNLDFSGGADDDIFQNDGLSASNISFTGDDGADAFINNSSAVNISFVGGGGDDIFANRGNGSHTINFFGEDGADILLNEGNNVSNIQFTGGVDDDNFTNDGNVIDGISFNGNDGVDIFVNNGRSVSNIVFAGGAGDDILQNNGLDALGISFFGGDGGDTFFNNGDNVGSVLFDGGLGGDFMFNKSENVVDIVFIGGLDNDTFRMFGDNFGSVSFIGDAGSDSLILTAIGAVGATVNFEGGGDSDLLAWLGSAESANVDLGAGNDFVVVSGSGELDLIGGIGSDSFAFDGNPDATVLVQEFLDVESDADVDTVDFSAFTGGAVNIDLRSTEAQQQSSEFSIQFSDGMGIENIQGTSGADQIFGNARDNIISGAEYRSFDEANEPIEDGPLAGKRDEIQYVLLDFDTFTNQGNGDVGEHVYSDLERQQIQRNMELAYWGPTPDSPDPANPIPDFENRWFNVIFTQNRDDIPVDEFVTVFFNETPSFGRPGGEASEIDLGNLNLGGTALVQVNGLLGGELTLADGDISEEGFVELGDLKPVASSSNFVTIATKIAAHELGHLLGLRHKDAFGPIGTGVYNTQGVDGFKPSYAGPAGGFEAFNHLMSTGKSIGTDRFDDLKRLYFGEREAIKLAYFNSDLADVNVAESSGPHSSFETAQYVPFATLAVPNTLQDGLNFGKEFFVQAASILGAIGLENGNSENDFYAFKGRAGELLNIDLSSLALRSNRFSTETYIDSVIRVYDNNRELLAYYDSEAVSDDEFESSDSTIIDLLLPADGTYYLEVDTFRRIEGDPNYEQAVELRTELEARDDLTDAEQEFLKRLQDSLDDTDVGNYQIFINRFNKGSSGNDFDAIKGLGGTDVIYAGPDVDYSLNLDIGGDAELIEGETFSRQIVFTDLGASQWSGTVSYGDGTATEDLSFSFVNGNPAFDLVHLYEFDGTFEVDVTIANDIGTVQSYSFTVVALPDNEPPTANDGEFFSKENTLLESSLASLASDSDGDELTFSVVDGSGPSHGDLQLNPDGSFTYQPFGEFVGVDSFDYQVDDGNGETATATVLIDVLNLVDLSGRVFVDIDNDGIYNPSGADNDPSTTDDNDYGIEGVRLQLWTAQNLIGEVITSAEGLYRFEADLESGTYSIVQVYDDPATELIEDEFFFFGVIDGDESVGNLGGVVDNAAGGNLIDQIVVGAAGSSDDGEGYNFAEILASSIQGLVWEDFDNDSEIDLNELAIGDVLITLSGIDDRGRTVSQSQLTSADGIYEFIGLRPGSYSILETQPESFVVGDETVALIDGKDVVGGIGDTIVGDNDGGTPALSLVNDRFNNVTLSQPGDRAVNYNFAERAQTGELPDGGVTATVGFWQSRNGKRFIYGLNGDNSSLQHGGNESALLGNWLAETFPNLYGAGATEYGYDLTDATNREVFEVFDRLLKRKFLGNDDSENTFGLWAPWTRRLDAEVMAVAMASYVTRTSLAGQVYAGSTITSEQAIAHVQSRGFHVSTGGLASTTFNVGNNGEAFGVEDHSDVLIMDLLLAVNDRSKDGLLYDLDGNGSLDLHERFLRLQAFNTFRLINWLGR